MTRNRSNQPDRKSSRFWLLWVMLLVTPIILVVVIIQSQCSGNWLDRTFGLNKACNASVHYNAENSELIYEKAGRKESIDLKQLVAGVSRDSVAQIDFQLEDELLVAIIKTASGTEVRRAIDLTRLKGRQTLRAEGSKLIISDGNEVDLARLFLAGPSGEPGKNGVNGKDGKDGAIGEKGEPGEPGPIGLTGPQGDAGPQGSTGPVGPQGPQGVPGVKGDKGDQGIQGIQGDKGEKGDQGVQGLAGPQGLKGDKGDQGTQGDKGDKGDQGVQGVQGEKGLQGLQGIKGDKGDSGVLTVSGGMLTLSGTNLQFNPCQAGQIVRYKDDTDKWQCENLTNTLTSANNTLTSTQNGIAATADIINRMFCRSMLLTS